MTTINISPQKLFTAASHALIDAKANHVSYKQQYENCSILEPLWQYYFSLYNNSCKMMSRLENLLAAAKACDGLVCMSMEDVALVRKYL